MFRDIAHITHIRYIAHMVQNLIKHVALSRATARSNIKILALPPNADEGDKEDENKDKKKSQKKDKRKPSVKEREKMLDNEKKKTLMRNGTYTKKIVYKEVLTL